MLRAEYYTSGLNFVERESRSLSGVMSSYTVRFNAVRPVSATRRKFVLHVVAENVKLSNVEAMSE